EEPRLAVAPTPTAGPTRVANAAPTAQNDGFFSSLARQGGLGRSGGATPPASTSSAPPPAKPKVIEAKRTEPPPRPEAAAPKPAAPKAVDVAKPALKPSVADAPAQAAAPVPNQVAGSAPIVSSNSFDSR